jgi:RNA-binding proteins (RRM domain)
VFSEHLYRKLPYETTGQELSDLFAEYGEVKSAKIITDRESGRSRGFGFVEMNDTEAKKAIEELNGIEYKGFQLTVNQAREKKDDQRNNRGGYNRYGGGGSRRNY